MTKVQITLADDCPGGEVMCVTVESKEFIRMAHWIIKEFG